MTENSLITINDYAVWLTELKQRIQSAQQRATLLVNRELVVKIDLQQLQAGEAE